MAAATAVALPRAARAQGGFPSRPVQLVVGWPPGGGVDAMARATALGLARELGVPVVVDNRPGAAGTVGTMAVARAAPDGHTLLFMSLSELAIRQAASATRTPYDLERDFVPVSLSGVTPIAVAVHPRVPARTPAELVAWLRARPRPTAWGSTGIGTLMHFAGEAFRAAIGAEMVHVPYRGAAPLATDLVAGQVEVGVSGVPPLMPLAADGRVRLVVATTARRTAVLPDVPTLTEVGIADLDIANYVGIAAPRATPSEALARIEAAAVAAARAPDVAEAFARSASVPIGGTAAEYAAFIAAERTRQTELIRATGFRIEE